jgi:hypothetical protein
MLAQLRPVQSVVVTVSATATLDPGTGWWTYSYSVTNEPSSQNALETFAEDENADVEHGNGGAGVGAGGIGRAAGRKPLPGHCQEHAERGEKEEYFVNRPKPNCRRGDGDGRRGRLNSGRNHPAILSQRI